MKITIQDYKPFRGENSIDIKPVTIIIGKNNSGKSSLTDYINFQLNTSNYFNNSIDEFVASLGTTSTAQLVNFHKWKYVPDDVISLLNADKLSKLGITRISEVLNELDISNVQQRISDNIFKHEEKYYNDKVLQRKMMLKLRFHNSSKKIKTNERARHKTQLKALEIQENRLKLKRQKLFEALQKLCSYDPEIFYQFKNSTKMIESIMTHWSFKKSDNEPEGLTLGSKYSKYLNYEDNLRLFTIVDSLRPYYSSGLIFNYELNPQSSLDRYNDIMDESWESIHESEFNLMVKKMYDGFKVSSNSSSKTNLKKPPLSKSLLFKKYKSSNRAFIDNIYQHFSKMDQLFKNGNSIPIYLKMNITDKEINNFYSSKNILFDGLRVDSKINSKKEPSVIYFEYGSEIYEHFKSFVINILSKAVPRFYELCKDDLDAIIHMHNKFYFKNRRESFFQHPNRVRINRLHRRNGYSKKLSNPYHLSIDNLPYKCIDLYTNLNATKNFSFKKLPKIISDKIINGIFLQRKSGQQFIGPELSRDGTQILHHERVGRYLNDVECIYEYNKKDPYSFIDNYFDYDRTNNKIFFKSEQNNPFSTPDLLSPTIDDSDSVEYNFKTASRREISVNNLIREIVDMFEAESVWYVKNKEKRGRSKNSLKFLEDRERFVIGSAISNSIAKIYEILYEDFIDEYVYLSLSAQNIVLKDGDDRRVSKLSSKIVNSDILPITKGKQYFNIKELKSIFGNDIESIISSESGKKRLLARLNNSLKDVGINYSVQIDAVPPTVRNRIIGEMLYVISLFEVNQNSETIFISDFSMVGEGTRSIITILLQIEVHRIVKRGTPCILIIREFENHLHPSLVGKFLEYLIQRVENTNIDLIIETHSEIILRTLQAIIKESSRGILDRNLDSKRVAVYYIDKISPGMSSIDKLDINSDGLFEKAPPKEFFDINSSLVNKLIDD